MKIQKNFRTNMAWIFSAEVMNFSYFFFVYFSFHLNENASIRINVYCFVLYAVNIIKCYAGRDKKSKKSNSSEKPSSFVNKNCTSVWVKVQCHFIILNRFVEFFYGLIFNIRFFFTFFFSLAKMVATVLV